MAKPNEKQLQILNYVEMQIRYWKGTNDINSPTHHGDMEEEIWKIENLFDDEKDKQRVMDSLSEILKVVRKNK